MQMMRIYRSPRVVRLVLLAALFGASMLHAVTPGIAVTATNVGINGQGTATSTFTVKSVNGFAGSVGIQCQAPATLPGSVLILPECNKPISDVAVSAGGSVSGTISFFPPASITGNEVSRNSSPRPDQPRLPLALGAVAGLGLLGFRFRKLLRDQAVLAIAAVGLCLLTGLAGCGGKGGLAMTPGTYTYTIAAAARTGTGTATTQINVTVHCDSCP